MGRNSKCSLQAKSQKRENGKFTTNTATTISVDDIHQQFHQQRQANAAIPLFQHLLLTTQQSSLITIDVQWSPIDAYMESTTITTNANNINTTTTISTRHFKQDDLVSLTFVTLRDESW